MANNKKKFEDEENESWAFAFVENEPPPLTSFFQMFPPAASLKTATLTLNTEEIQERIARHSGTMCGIEPLYNWLVFRGYNFDSLGEGQLVWLLEERE